MKIREIKFRKIVIPNKKADKKTDRRTRRGKRISWGYLFPSLAGVLLFFVLPFLVVIYYSMVDNPINKQFVFFENFVKVFNNAAFQQAASNTMKFSLVAVPLAVVLSLLLANDAGERDSLQESVSDVFSKSHDGSRGFHHTDLAGFISL